FGGDRGGVVSCSAFDAILRAPGFRARHAPDLILELGAPPTSAGYAALLADHPGAPRVVVAPHGWNDPRSDAAALLLADPADLAPRVAERLPPGSAPSPWARAFSRAGALADAIVDRALAGELVEPAIAREVSLACPEGSLLCIGNSTPVRDLDLA